MRAITIREPYLWAITHAGKTVENRTRTTSYRGQVALHGSANRTLAGLDDWRVVRAITAPNAPAVELSYGLIAAVADLVDCHPADGCCDDEWGEQPSADFPRLFHLKLARVRLLSRRVPAKGALALPWTCDPDVAAAVETALDVVAVEGRDARC